MGRGRSPQATVGLRRRVGSTRAEETTTGGNDAGIASVVVVDGSNGLTGWQIARRKLDCRAMRWKGTKTHRARVCKGHGAAGRAHTPDAQLGEDLDHAELDRHTVGGLRSGRPTRVIGLAGFARRVRDITRGCASAGMLTQLAVHFCGSAIWDGTTCGIKGQRASRALAALAPDTAGTVPSENPKSP